MRTISTLIVAAAALSCAPGANIARAPEPLSYSSSASAAPVPPECLRSEMALDPDRSLDTFFDSAQATSALTDAWPPLLGTVLLVVEADGQNGSGSWAAMSDMPNVAVVQSIAETFRATQRNVPAPDRELKIFLGDEDEVQPRLLQTFEGCAAQVVGLDGVEERLLQTAEALSAHDGVDEVLAVDVDPWGRPTSLIYTGDADEPELRGVTATALLASARFRPAYVEGVAIPSRLHLANAEVFAGDLRQVSIAGLDDPLRGGWRDARGNAEAVNRITTASRSGNNGGVPCGRGSSQFAVMCGYDFATGRVTSTTTNGWLGAADRIDRMSERGKVSFQIDQRLGRNR